MTGTLLVTPDTEFEAQVKRAFDGELEAERWWDTRLPHLQPETAAREIAFGEPAVVVVGPGVTPQVGLALAESLDLLFPEICVVLVAKATTRLWELALRAGVREIIPVGADDGQVSEALSRAGAAAARRQASSGTAALREEAPRGRVITVMAPKGGAGKTTVSTNLAIGLTAVAPQSTVLVDLDVQFGDCASALGLTPEYTLPDAVHGPASEDTMVLKTFLTQHPSGLYAVCGSESPAEGDTVTGADVSRLLGSLAREFRYVVVDTAPGLSEQTLAALDRATDVIMLTSMDVPGVRGLRKELDVLRELAMIPAGRHVVMNFADPRGGLTVRDVETTIGTGVDVVLPRSSSVPPSTNQGVPLLQSGGRRDPMVKELRRLVSRFSATPLMRPGRYRAKHRAA